MNRSAAVAVAVAAVFVLLLVILNAPSDIKKNTFTIKSVIDGNTVQLLNGYQVVLLGVAGSDESANYLKGFVNKRVRLIMDKSTPALSGEKAEGKRIYAYVKQDKLCLNSHILKEKLSPLCISPNLSDSLESYAKYTGYSLEGRSKRYDGSLYSPHGSSFSGWSSNCSDNCPIFADVVDFTSSTTRNYAVNLAAKFPGNYNFGQVCALFDYLNTHWKYVNDPVGSEYTAKASETISLPVLAGDCDDFAVLLCACINAIGGNARINIAFNATSGHAFTEVDVTPFGLSEAQMTKEIKKYFKEYSIGSPNTRTDGGRTWLNLDWSAKYAGGPYYNFTHCTSYRFNPSSREWVCD